MKNPLLPLLLCALSCTAAQATTITVNSAVDAMSDGTNCTLRGAVDAINGGTGNPNCTSSGGGTADTIAFSLSPGATIPVTAFGQIEIDPASGGDLIINAPDGITLDAAGGTDNRIFNVTGGNSLSITGVTFRNGNAGSSSGGAIEVDTGNLTLTLEQCALEGNQANYGGAVDINNNSSTVIIRNSTFSGNTATSSGGAVQANTATIRNSTFSGNKANYGGAVYAYNTATISNSTFSNNEAGDWGGAVDANTATIRNSTFSGNTATSSGGAVRANTATIRNSTFSGNEAGDWGGAVRAVTATIRNSTFSGNEAGDWGGAVFASSSLDARHLTLLNNTAGNNGQALYVYDSSGTATLHNSIIIGSNGNSSAQCVKDGGTFTGSYNLEGWADLSGWQGDDNSCGGNIAAMPNTGDALSTIIATTLDDHGGLTQTLALSAGSPAIGAADPTGANSETHDQRGYTRMAQTYGRDLGAYEALRFAPSPNLPDATVGTVYSQNLQAGGCLPTTAGGTDCSLTFTSTSLPNWLALGATDGLLSGTPPQPNTESFGVMATDHNAIGNPFYENELNLTIRALPTGSTPIPVLPVPLLLGLAAALGLLGRRRLTQRA